MGGEGGIVIITYLFEVPSFFRRFGLSSSLEDFLCCVQTMHRLVLALIG